MIEAQASSGAACRGCPDARPRRAQAGKPLPGAEGLGRRRRRQLAVPLLTAARGRPAARAGKSLGPPRCCAWQGLGLGSHVPAAAHRGPDVRAGESLAHPGLTGNRALGRQGFEAVCIALTELYAEPAALKRQRKHGPLQECSPWQPRTSPLQRAQLQEFSSIRSSAHSSSHCFTPKTSLPLLCIIKL